MDHIYVQLIAILCIVVLLLLGKSRLSQLGFRGDDLSQLVREFQRHMPVYSAETIQSREAEFIRDRLRKRFLPWAIPLAILLAAAVIWWLTKAS